MITVVLFTTNWPEFTCFLKNKEGLLCVKQRLKISFFFAQSLNETEVFFIWYYVGVKDSKLWLSQKPQFPDGLGVRIPDSHSGGPGSIPGQGEFLSN